MSDKRVFIDSNIILYLFTNDNIKKEKVNPLLNKDYFISTQVVNENVNVCLRKLKLSKEEAYAHGSNLLDSLHVVNIYSSTIAFAFNLSIKYQYGFWDSLIIAAALENNCEILLSEDLADGQLIEKKLRIKNPFINDWKP